jgi:hypothetical protein
MRAQTAPQPGVTAVQVSYALRLLREAELPTREVTVMHRLIFQRAGIPWKDGQNMGELLGSLTGAGMGRLIDQLRDDEQEEQ